MVQVASDQLLSVFLEDKDTGSKIYSNRFIVQNFRRQMRGIGAASFLILSNKEVNQVYSPETEIKMFNNRRVWICDQSLMSDPKSLNEPNAILWHGTIRATTLDIYEGDMNATGFAAAEEIGHYLGTQPVIRTQLFPPFNPFIDGRWMANKKLDELAFSNDIIFPANTLRVGKVPMEWASTQQPLVWSRAEVIQFLLQEMNLTVKFPDELDAEVLDRQMANKIALLNSSVLNTPEETAQAIATLVATNASQKQALKTNYNYFYNKKNPISFDTYEGQGLHDILRDLLTSPFDYHLDYTSSLAGITVVITNSSTLDLPGLCPAAGVAIDFTPGDVVNLNIAKDDNEVYDKLVFRGGPLRFCGTLAVTDPTSAFYTLEKDWSDYDQSSYVQGKVILNGDQAIATTDYETVLKKAEAVRAQITKRVYTNFRFRRSNSNFDCWIQVSKNAGGFTEQTNAGDELRPFFPNVLFTTTVNGTPQLLSTPVFEFDVNKHRTPCRYAEWWDDYLPFIDPLTIKIGNDDGMAEYARRNVITRVQTSVDKFSFINFTGVNGLANPAQFNFSNWGGVAIHNQIREAVDANLDIFFQFTSSGAKFGQPGQIGDWSKAVSQLNPVKSSNYSGFTHWSTYLCTFSGRSAQYLEYTFTRPGSTGTKTKLVNDDTYNCWFVHPNTAVSVITDPTRVPQLPVDYPKTLSSTTPNFTKPATWNNYVDRFIGGGVNKDQPVMVRDDRKLMLDAGQSYANFLFQERTSFKVDYPLFNYKPVLQIGSVIRKVKDKGVDYSTNSIVTSIEYNFATPSNTLVHISTNIPDLPNQKKIETQKISSSLPQVAPIAGDVRSASIVINKD
jgi:hypothetical protein